MRWSVISSNGRKSAMVVAVNSLGSIARATRATSLENAVMVACCLGVSCARLLGSGVWKRSSSAQGMDCNCGCAEVSVVFESGARGFDWERVRDATGGSSASFVVASEESVV